MGYILLEDCSSSSENYINEIRSKKRRKRHHYNLRSCPESTKMTQPWNVRDEVFIRAVNLQIAKCEPGLTFSSQHWTALTKYLKHTKEEIVIRLKKLRGECILFNQLLAEEHVAYNYETGILNLPNYFWEDNINKVKYANFKKERNFKTLKQWCSIFDTNTIYLDDDTRSVNTTKRQRNEVMADSSKKSKSSMDYECMEMTRQFELQQCDMIFKSWRNSGYISMTGSMKLREALKNKGDANYFLTLDLINDKWCYASETLKEVAERENRDISVYIIKDLVEDLVD